MTLKTLLASAALALPTLAFATGAFAAGDDDASVPAAPACEDGMVWDADTQTCTAPQDARLDDAERYKAVRAYAYAGQLDAAIAVLDAMEDQNADGVLTYRGFTARKAGDAEAAMGWYTAALALNPDNLLVRSYMGQGFVDQGQYELAAAQLTEIRARGGRGTWAELSLRMALDSGVTSSY